MANTMESVGIVILRDVGWVVLAVAASFVLTGLYYLTGCCIDRHYEKKEKKEKKRLARLERRSRREENSSSATTLVAHPLTVPPPAMATSEEVWHNVLYFILGVVISGSVYMLAATFEDSKLYPWKASGPILPLHNANARSIALVPLMGGTSASVPSSSAIPPSEKAPPLPGPFPLANSSTAPPSMSTTQDESSLFSEPPMGMPAQMKLAGLAIMSFLQGVYFALVLAMFYLLSRRITPMTRGKSGKSSDRKLVVGLLVLTVVSTGHWVCLVIRAFEAFIFWEDGQHADLYYSGTATSSSVARAVLHGATAVVSDMFVIARLYVIWDYSKWVVIFPSVSLVGQLVSTMGHAQSYASYNVTSYFAPASLHHWRLAACVSTLCVNIYCTVMVLWRAGHVHYRRSEYNSGPSIMSAAILIAESAAFYTFSVLISQITYTTGHISNYFFTDTVPFVAALSAVLVHARAILVKGRVVDDGKERVVHTRAAVTPTGRWRGCDSISVDTTVDVEEVEESGRYSPLQIRVERPQEATAEVAEISRVPSALTRGW
ncbi:hypothetical protein GGF50DRAFT_119733 [Schizophyllum commune]